MKKLYEVTKEEGESSTYYRRFDGKSVLVSRLGSCSLGGVMEVYGSKWVGCMDYGSNVESYWDGDRNARPYIIHFIGDKGDYVVRSDNCIRTFETDEFHKQFVKDKKSLSIDNVKKISVA